MDFETMDELPRREGSRLTIILKECFLRSGHGSRNHFYRSRTYKHTKRARGIYHGTANNKWV